MKVGAYLNMSSLAYVPPSGRRLIVSVLETGGEDACSSVCRAMIDPSAGMPMPSAVHVAVPPGKLAAPAGAAATAIAATTPRTAAARVLTQEHRIYPLALQRLARGELRVVGRRVIGGLP